MAYKKKNKEIQLSMFSEVDYKGSEAKLADPYYDRKPTTVWGTKASLTVIPAKEDPAKQEMKERMARAFALKHMKFVNSKEEALADPDTTKDIYFPVSDGYAVLQHLTVGGNSITSLRKVKECNLFPKLEKDSIESLTIVNKIPAALFLECIASFSRICDKTGSEAAAQIYRKRDTGEYFIYYPEQYATGGSVTYADDQNVVTLRVENELVMELHSHDTMSAFWSGTDDANETECGFYTVVGNLNATKASYCCRAKNGTAYIPLKLSDIFDMPLEEEEHFLLRAERPSGNPEIDTKVKERTYATYGGYGAWGDEYDWYSSYGTTTKEKVPFIPPDPSTYIKTDAQRKLKEILDKSPDVLTDHKIISEMWLNYQYDTKTFNWYFSDFVYFSHSIKNEISGWVRVNKEGIPVILEKEAAKTKEIKSNTVTTAEIVTKFNPDTENMIEKYAKFYNYHAARESVLAKYLYAGETLEEVSKVTHPDFRSTYADGYKMPDYNATDSTKYDEELLARAKARILALYTSVKGFRSKCGDEYQEDEVLSKCIDAKAFTELIGNGMDLACANKQFDPMIMWELFDNFEKSILCRLFDTDLVTLAQWIRDISVNNTNLNYYLVQLLYLGILAGQDKRVEIIAFIDYIDNQFKYLVKDLADKEESLNTLEKINAYFNFVLSKIEPSEDVSVFDIINGNVVIEGEQ